MSDNDPKVSVIRARRLHSSRLAGCSQGMGARALTAAWSKASVKEQEKETLAQPVDSFIIIQ